MEILFCHDIELFDEEPSEDDEEIIEFDADDIIEQEAKTLSESDKDAIKDQVGLLFASFGSPADTTLEYNSIATTTHL